MNKTDIIRKVAEETNQSQAIAARVIDAFLDRVMSEVTDGKEVSISGFGKFYCQEKSARTGRNPRTGEAIEIASRTAAKFKPFKGFKGDY